MTIDNAVLADEHFTPTDTVDAAEPLAVDTSILLDSRRIKRVLDVVGAATLFLSVAFAMSVRDAVLITAAVGFVVLASRSVRWFTTLRRVVRETTPRE